MDRQSESFECSRPDGTLLAIALLPVMLGGEIGNTTGECELNPPLGLQVPLPRIACHTLTPHVFAPAKRPRALGSEGRLHGVRICNVSTGNRGAGSKSIRSESCLWNSPRLPEGTLHHGGAFDPNCNTT